MIRNYQKNFMKLKSAMGRPKLYGRSSESAVLPIQTVNAAFYVSMRNNQLQHTKKINF